jgi:hypothetical protein
MYIFYFILFDATKALLHAHCKLNQPVFQVISTTSQIKYNHLLFFDCILLSSSLISIHPQVAFASFQLLQSCNQNSIFSSLSICSLKKE